MARNPGCTVFIGEISPPPPRALHSCSTARGPSRPGRSGDSRGGSVSRKVSSSSNCPVVPWICVRWLEPKLRGVAALIGGWSCCFRRQNRDGNLDDKVPERVLYEILIQVGRVVDLHIPRDKETSRPKGYAFAEYETEEIAQYAVKLFSGLVRLQNRTLRFAISGQDKPSSNGNMPVTPRLNSVPQPKPPQPMRSSDSPLPQHTAVNGRSAGYGISPNHSYDTHSQAPSSGLPSRGLSNGTYEYSRRVFGSVLNDVSRQATKEPVPYPSY